MVKELIAQDPRDLRKIDALVAEHVMGLEKPREELADLWDSGKVWICPETTCPERLPYYSSSIAAAWEVVEKLREDKWRPLIDHSYPGETTVEIEFGEAGDEDHAGRFYITHATAPLAICHAALRAKGVTVE